jgi:membrane protein YdbS with pleckstrin-like domain
MFRLAEQRSEPAVSTFAFVASGAVALACCIGCAVVVASLTGFPLLVLGACGCVLALAALIALFVYRRHAAASTSPYEST